MTNKLYMCPECGETYHYEISNEQSIHYCPFEHNNNELWEMLPIEQFTGKDESE